MMGEIYLDCASTTPVDPRVVEAMLPYLQREFGNAASRNHAFGWRAEAAVETARERVAALINADPKEVIFTSGATESDNLAILGTARANASRGKHLITTPIEHKAVLDPLEALEKREGFVVTRVSLDEHGCLAPESIAHALCEETLLVSAMAVNNETGLLILTSEIGKLCRGKGVLFHCDAAQAFGKIPIDVKRHSIDLLSISAHKIHGPKGIGALFVRGGSPRIQLAPLMYGGGHERGLRSGTLNVPAIVGFGEAARIAALEMERDFSHAAKLSSLFLATMRKHAPRALSNATGLAQIPHISNWRFPGVEAEALLLAVPHIAASTGSACMTATGEPSHVLKAMGFTPEEVKSSIRFSWGRFTTEAEVEAAAIAVAKMYHRLASA